MGVKCTFTHEPFQITTNNRCLSINLNQRWLLQTKSLVFEYRTRTDKNNVLTIYKKFFQENVALDLNNLGSTLDQMIIRNKTL